MQLNNIYCETIWEMKRTKEAYYRENPSFQQTQHSSGVTFVIGEDESYHDRTKHYQNLQK